MPSGITRARVTSCCSLVIRISATSRSLFNAGSDWVGSCAITIKRRRDCIPKVQSQNSDSARCDWEIEEVAEAALLPVAPTLRSGKLDRPVKYRRFRRCDILAIWAGRIWKFQAGVSDVEAGGAGEMV